MNESAGLDVAIIGMSIRFPGARTLEAFWRNLSDGVEAVRFFSDEELRSSGIDPSLLAHPHYVKARAVLDDVELFDAQFFGFTSPEAQATNPQQRLFMECAWEALEGAGYPPSSHDHSVGVFATAGTNNYQDYCVPLVQQGLMAPFLVGLGNDREHLSSRVSYKFDLRGPSLVVQTACSSSLVAVHLACQSLLVADCDIALAGGAFVGMPPVGGYLAEEGSMYSLDGRCRSFDARATGTVRGDGVGVVVLKRLADAVDARDHIFAVIKGSAINNDGAMKVGYTAPGVAGLVDVIRSAQMVAGVEADTIGYVECHGTGTPLGDPVELAALTKVFAAATDQKGFCAVGSVKSSIGHLDVAGGIAGLVKTVLAVDHGQIPPSLHFTKPNPEIDFANSAFHVAITLEPWPIAAPPRRAAVNSYGLGGTNAHVILEQAPAPEPARCTPTHVLVPVSAPTAASLDRVVSQLCTYLRRTPAINLPDVAYTLQVGRKHFQYRRAVVAQSGDVYQLCETLAEPERAISSTAQPGRAVAFVFPAGGSVSASTARALYTNYTPYREAIEQMMGAVSDRVARELRQRLCTESAPADYSAEQHGALHMSQTALFAIEYALARLWMHWGLRPVAMIGHGIGERIAAVLADVVALEDVATVLDAGMGMAHASSEFVARRCRPPQIPYISSITGTWVTSEQVRVPDYWRHQADSPVSRVTRLSHLLAGSKPVVLVVGPDVTLSSFVARESNAGFAFLNSLPTTADSSSIEEHLLTTLARLWTTGVEVDWHAFSASYTAGRIWLPTFPFERKRYWPDAGHEMPPSQDGWDGLQTA